MPRIDGVSFWHCDFLAHRDLRCVTNPSAEHVYNTDNVIACFTTKAGLSITKTLYNVREGSN